MKADVKNRGGKGRASRGRSWAGSLAELARAAVRPLVPSGLSPRLLVLTAIFVLVSEVFIYVPSVASFRVAIMMQHLQAAQIAALALEASENDKVGADLSKELLANAGVLSVVLKRNEQRSLFLSPGQMPPQAVKRYDLAKQGPITRVVEAFKLLFRTHDRIISVRGVPRLKGGISIEAVMHEAPIRAELLAFSRTILAGSILISLLTAACVFAAIHLLLVRPMMRIQRSMTEFRRSPEDATAIVHPSDRRDEIGTAERELAAMQADLRMALHQRARLAALGSAVAKINHDLRNMLSSAQLFVDRLEKSEDPLVQRLAPKLVAAIGRAVNLCANTLRYGKAEEPAPDLRPFDLRKLASDVGANLFGENEGLVVWRNDVPEDLHVIADPDQIFRVLLNLARNAAQAIEVAGEVGEIRIEARRGPTSVQIVVRDTGPGVPPEAQARLFQPFASSGRPGGSGLGLAIASELISAHGGTIALISTGDEGTSFRITLPYREA